LADIKDESVAFLEFANDEGSPCEAWQRRFPGAWLVVPLRFRDELTGFAVLARPRAARRLDWEDRNLIRLVAMQLALFLVHEQIAQELADSQQLIEFNNRVAFALHDLKNTIGQLNLIRHNAARFGDDPRFRADMMTSIGQAVENLQTLMGKLKNDRVPPSAREQPARIDVSAIVARCADRKSASGVIVRHGNGPVFADIANPEDFEGALEHVLSNAVEASRPGSNVQLSVEETNGRVRVKVEDSGPGMSPEFLANDFFRPLRTTKENGLGIGAYQARAMMRGLGGDMEVQSSVGQGTTVSLLLPACVDAERRVSQ
jgi:putative PEP-CTERM system histidine kinase